MPNSLDANAWLIAGKEKDNFHVGEVRESNKVNRKVRHLLTQK
jgi:hypothetical protein